MVRKYSGSCTGTQVTNVSHSGFSLGDILEGYSDSPRVTSETNKVKGSDSEVLVSIIRKSFTKERGWEGEGKYLSLHNNLYIIHNVHKRKLKFTGIK